MKRTVFSIAIVALTFLLFARASEDGQAQAVIDGAPNEHAVRAILYEEDPGNSAGNKFEGSVKWLVDKADMESEGQYQLRAEIVIPKRRLSASLAIRLNLDQTFQASHIAEFTFALSSDSQDGVATVRGILVKQIENIRGTPVPGVAVKLRPSVFAIAYPDDQVEETTELLYGRRWLEIAMIFVNGRRALLAFDKDVSGTAAFKQVFSSWGQLNPRIAQAVARVDLIGGQRSTRNSTTGSRLSTRDFEHFKR